MIVLKYLLVEYYFDTETASLPQYRGEKKAGTDPCKARIITIQYQKLDSRTGQSLEPLQILREWDYDERSILEQFRKLYLTGNNWTLFQ